MNKGIAIAASILAIIAAAGIVVWIIMKNVPVDNPKVNIYLNGELLKTLPLNENGEFTVECEAGYNVIRIEKNSVFVSAADCPDKVCVNTGAISGGTVPIVCLPHRVEVRVVSGSSETDAVI